MKAIAMVDIPDNVFDIYEELTIRGNINFGGEHLLVMTLKPLPEKKETCSVIDYASGKAMIDEYENEFNLGFNACLDEILGDYITQEEADLCGIQFWHDD